MQNHKKDIFRVLGIMSGSSFDGVDLAFCELINEKNKWSYSILNAETVPYNKSWFEKLKEAEIVPGEMLVKLHHDFGIYLGFLSRSFIEKNRLKVDLIASHGHTVFHQPMNGISFQLGEGQALATTSGNTVINDFRVKDIQMGGQGAPLVPIGDKLLFGEFGYCLNIGGIANISFQEKGNRIAFDVCPANQILNHLSQQLGKFFDQSGAIAESGRINHDLLEKLNNDPFYQKSHPKSLSNQYVHDHFIQLIDDCNDSFKNKLNTAITHIVDQLVSVFGENVSGSMLVTGGGAHNNYLINQIKLRLPVEIAIPDHLLIDYKEALVFALLGVLRIRNEVNCLASVTGAKADSCCGVVYLP
jgi:anhydro-N-acetylmuramic acid kinase